MLRLKGSSRSPVLPRTTTLRRNQSIELQSISLSLRRHPVSFRNWSQTRKLKEFSFGKSCFAAILSSLKCLSEIGLGFGLLATGRRDGIPRSILWPAYEGKTSLTIEPRQKRVLVLPEVELGPGERLATVVTLEYKVEDKENGLKSRFEIN